MMSIKSKNCSVSFSCQKKPTDVEHEKIRERINDPYTLTGIDRLRAFHQMKGLEFDENIFEKIIAEYSLDD